MAEKAGRARTLGLDVRCWPEARGEPKDLAEEGSHGAAGVRVCAAHGREGEVQERKRRSPLMPNVRAKLPAEAGTVSPA